MNHLNIRRTRVPFLPSADPAASWSITRHENIINLSGPVNKMIIFKYLHSTVMAHQTSRSETAHAKIKIHIITLSELQTKVSKQQSNVKNK